MTAGSRRREGDGDRGAATVWAAFAACALCVVFGAVLALGQAVAARHRAGGAADLAALAAADRAPWGEAEACAVAARVATAQGAELVRCGLGGEIGEIAEVTVRVVLGPYRPELASRAGPPSLPNPSGMPGAAGPPDPPGKPDPADPADAVGTSGTPVISGIPATSRSSGP